MKNTTWTSTYLHEPPPTMRRSVVPSQCKLIVRILTFATMSLLRETCDCLSTPAPIKRIAIIGSGISGLAVAQALTNNPNRNAAFDVVDIFDSRPSLDTTAGAGIQLNGGLSVLGKINPALQEAVYAAGLPQVRVQSRCKPWFGDDKFDTLLELDLKKTVESAGGDIAASLLSPDRRLWWTSIMRGALQQVLLDTLPSNVRVHFGRKLTKLQPASEDGGVCCRFFDGSETGPYDLVIGCEGINSAVKNYIDSNGQPNDDDGDSSAKSAIYSGLRIRYAVSDGSLTTSSETAATLTQFFGRGAYALHGIYGAGAGKPNTQCAFIVYLDDNYIGPFKKTATLKSDASVTVGENADWSQDKRSALAIAKENMLEQLRVCEIPSAFDDDLGRTIAQADRFFELGSYYHNPFRKWSRAVRGCQAHVVLCGDAAHALPPFLGQGSNQAIQDAYCLSEMIFAYNAKVHLGDSKAKLQDLLNEYESIRWPACFNVFWKAAFLGYLETGGINGFYSKFRDTFFKTMGVVGVASRVLLNAAAPKT